MKIGKGNVGRAGKVERYRSDFEMQSGSFDRANRVESDVFASIYVRRITPCNGGGVRGVAEASRARRDRKTARVGRARKGGGSNLCVGGRRYTYTAPVYGSSGGTLGRICTGEMWNWFGVEWRERKERGPFHRSGNETETSSERTNLEFPCVV